MQSYLLVDYGLMRALIRVLESIKAGKRLPEAQFSTMKLSAKGQQSVYGMFKATGE